MNRNLLLILSLSLMLQAACRPSLPETSEVSQTSEVSASTLALRGSGEAAEVEAPTVTATVTSTPALNEVKGLSKRLVEPTGPQSGVLRHGVEQAFGLRLEANGRYNLRYNMSYKYTVKTNSPRRALRHAQDRRKARREKMKMDFIKIKILRQNFRNLKANFKNLSDLCVLRGASDLLAVES
ncbi:MAG: hypothetical protein D6803_00270 [Anaerolineae bacterium]|nr:MAG: hypothetical protein D6803_00270 [Anaerolineae bacterium]